jgi:predicted regulator of Ras-like GTPase activity (Roadblock/LC7/MglB family)
MRSVSEVVSSLSRVPGVVAAMVVGASDGLIIEASQPVGMAPGAPDARKPTAALAAYLYSKTARASDAARLGTPAFMRLEAERGHICVVGASDIVLVTIVTPDANLGRVRLDMMNAARDSR